MLADLKARLEANREDVNKAPSKNKDAAKTPLWATSKRECKRHANVYCKCV